MKRTLFALALAAALPLSAQARDLDYSYVELDYARMNIDGADIDPTGFGLRGSVEVADSWYLFGAYQQGNDDFAGVDIDLDTTQAGIGWRHGISDKADFNAELSYLHQTVDIGENIPLPVPPCGCGGGGFIPGAGGSADGYRASAGVRGMLAKNFEGWAKANYTDGSDFDGDFSGSLGGQVKFGGMWGVTAEAEFGGDEDIYSIGLRASF